MKTLHLFTLNMIVLTCLSILFLPHVEAQSWIDFETDSARIDGTVVVNDAYSLPEDAGSVGEVMTSNGSGQAEWMSLPTAPSTLGTYVYMTPFVCGNIDGQPFPVISNRNDGQYQTSIVISNPAFGAASITRYVTHTHEQMDTLISPDSIQAPALTSVTNSLSRFHAFALTCEQIYDILGYTPDPVTPIFEGHVILESDEKIAVSVTYTYYDVDAFIEVVNQGGAGGIGIGSSIDVERIDPIFVESPPIVE